MSTGIIPINSRRIRTIKTKGYSRSSLPLINKEDYAILYGLILALFGLILGLFEFTLDKNLFSSDKAIISMMGLHPLFVSGFIDAEGSFGVSVRKKTQSRLG